MGRVGWGKARRKVLMVLMALRILAGAEGLQAQFNAIVDENAKTGNPRSQWDISGSGDAGIQGFATQMSVNKGEVVRFKIKTNASAYRLDIYRLGYYGGLGARLVATVTPQVPLPQSQPNPLTDPQTGLIDCGNWGVSASWTVPATAPSGIYLVKLVRGDTGGASHVIFVVRDDQGASDILFQTSDTTWQAYNSYGGNSLYTGSPAGRAYKVSYNRPFITRAGATSYDWIFNAEYPMVRWLEANGYNVSYSTGVDTESRGSLLRTHRVFLSVGHDEYWSGNQRANVESARAAGVSLGFFSGNEVFWKTRWEPSIDGSATPYRTLVCYKETLAGAKIDPTATWTGTWRDPRFSPPADGGFPENALTGTIFTVNASSSTDRIAVPYAYSRHWLWRNSGVDTITPGSTAVLAVGTLGYEWDEPWDNGSAPPGLLRLSETTLDGVQVLVDYGGTYETGSATHQLTWYRHNSGAFVFGAGTAQWSWGLDSTHDNNVAAVSSAMRQATVNLFAKMSVQPGSLQPGLVAGSPVSDSAAPVTTITAPVNGATVRAGRAMTVTGTAADSGGQVWAVEVSTDGGENWHAAVGTGNWSYAWVPAGSGTLRILSRAVDDTGNLEIPGPGVGVTVDGAQGFAGSVWDSSVVPGTVDAGPDSPVELGVKFRPDVSGRVTGIRFYKSSANTGRHVANLWDNTGARLATATFNAETASGWQQVLFSTPVAVSAGVTYVASYFCPLGHYSADEDYFLQSGVDVPPLHFPASGEVGGNGVYAYGSASSFPNQVYFATNYWVDLVFEPANAPVLDSIALSPVNPVTTVGGAVQFTATATYSDGSVKDVTGQSAWASGNPAVAGVDSSGRAVAVSAGTVTISATLSGVTAGTTLSIGPAALVINTASLPGGTVNVGYFTSLAASGGTTPYSWSPGGGSLPAGLTLNATTGVISGTPSAAGAFNFTVAVADSANPRNNASKNFTINIGAAPVGKSLWPSGTLPVVADSGPDASVELGVRFRSDVPGTIAAVRFYKGVGNTGTHTGSLWSSGGVLLATGVFSGETSSGWQQLNFTKPVAISANTVYVASYHTTVGHYSDDQNYFQSKGADNAPLHAPGAGQSGGNGVYVYGSGTAFPNQVYKATNYWVDVVFLPQ